MEANELNENQMLDLELEAEDESTTVEIVGIEVAANWGGIQPDGTQPPGHSSAPPPAPPQIG